MILGQVSWFDCFSFLIFLAPQLIIHAGFFQTLRCGLVALPFLVFKLPISLFHERYATPREKQPLFVQQASLFEDLVIRCVRYAFKHIPVRVSRVFFSKAVALPWLRFRMLRHGYLRSPIHWEEVIKTDFRGLWIIGNKTQKPDIIIYYAHGGGFAMGTTYFYLEFLLAWLTLLKTDGGFRNPAIFSIEYSLVPDESYPTQLYQAIAGYKHVLSISGDSSKVCVGGDSAGGTLILTLLLHLSSETKAPKDIPTDPVSCVPGMAALVSPWVTLISAQDRNNASDYLDADNLHRWAWDYVGESRLIDDPMISPGTCKDGAWWQRAAPTNGFVISYGSEEVFAPEIEDLVRLLKSSRVSVDTLRIDGGIHAWAVASLFLGSSRAGRQKYLKAIVEKIRERMKR